MTPELLAVSALLRSMERRDFAGASRLVMMRETLDGLAAVAEPVLRAERWREMVTAWHAEQAARDQRRLERDMRELVTVLARLLGESGDPSYAPLPGEFPVLRSAA
jgi:hypothetical protein